MYKPIQLSQLGDIDQQIKNNNIIESFDIGFNNNPKEIDYANYVNNVYQEAVFSNGKQQLDGILKLLQKIKDQLEEEIKKDNDGYSKEKRKSTSPFDPKKFWKNNIFKDLEDELQKVLGCRFVSIQPFIERYIRNDNIFESKQLNAYTYTVNRYPIDGLVTDKGFYDKTHSIYLEVHISLGIIRILTAEELLAVLIHEIGHNIDPALVNIKYTEVNILSKYLTDRKGSLTDSEKKLRDKKGFIEILTVLLLSIAFLTINALFTWIKELFIGKEKLEEQKLEKIRDAVKKDKDEFERTSYSEAFADNFARMYGYGSQLISALKKLSKDMNDHINSRYKKEKQRQEVIVNITTYLIKDVHKTDIHRAKALIKEYYNDINDPNTPEKVKKQLKEDVTELEKILESYTKDFGDFQNKANKVIINELEKAHPTKKEDDKSSDKDKKTNDKEIKESFEYYTPISLSQFNNISRELAGNQIRRYGDMINYSDDEFNESGLLFHQFSGNESEAPSYISESRKAYEKMMKDINAISQSERNEFYKIHGKSNNCSLAKDKDGYYVRTHRARSKSYKNIEDIPKKDVEFVRSTS